MLVINILHISQVMCLSIHPLDTFAKELLIVLVRKWRIIFQFDYFPEFPPSVTFLQGKCY